MRRSASPKRGSINELWGFSGKRRGGCAARCPFCLINSGETDPSRDAYALKKCWCEPAAQVSFQPFIQAARPSLLPFIRPSIPESTHPLCRHCQPATKQAKTPLSQYHIRGRWHHIDISDFRMWVVRGLMFMCSASEPASFWETSFIRCPLGKSDHSCRDSLHHKYEAIRG